MRTNLRACAIINFILAAFSILVLKWFSVVSVGFLAITGIIYYQFSYYDIQRLQNNKSVITILAIISIFFNFITSIILLFVRDQIKNEYNQFCKNKGEGVGVENNYNQKIKDPVSPEVKKIDMLLKLGALMVFISGLIFSTTSWEVLPNIAKVIALIPIGIMFCGLSKFSEIKLKLKNSTIMYWILGMLFFILSFISAGYFSIFGEWFSFQGSGAQIYFVVLSLIISILSIITYNKFNINALLYLSFSGVLVSIILLLDFIGCTIDINLLITISLITFLNLFIRDNSNIVLIYFKKFLNIVTYILTFAILTKIEAINNWYIFVPISIISILSLMKITFSCETTFSGIYTAIVSILIILYSMLKFNINSIEPMVMITLVYTILYIFLMVTKLLFKNKAFEIVFSIGINAILVINFIFGLMFTDNNSIALVASISSLMVNILATKYKKNEEWNFAYLVQPLKVIGVTLAVTKWLNADILRISALLRICISSIVLLLIYYCVKDKKLKFVYFISFFSLLIFNLFLDIMFRDILVGIFLFVAYPLAFIITKLNNSKEYRELETVTFLFMTLSVYMILVYVNPFNTLRVLSCISVIIIYSILMLSYRKEKNLFNILSFVMVLPLIKGINSVDYNGDIKAILSNMLFFYLLFLLCRNLVSNPRDRNLLLTIISIILILPIIFRQGLLVAVYVGIVGLIIIFYSFSKSEYKSFFTLGIVITIANIVIQLRELWDKLPFWLYLLIAGLSLIGFVTYKESKKIEK